jgi:hypothetical protein
MYGYFKHSCKIYHELLRLPQPIVRGKLSLLYHKLRTFNAQKYRYSEKTCFNSSGCYGNRHSIAIHNITCNKKNTIFLSLTPYRLIKPYRRFGGLCSLNIHGRMIFYNEDGGRVVRRNVVKFLPDYEASSGTFHIEDPHKLGNTVGTKFSHPGYLESGICAPLTVRGLLQMAA